ncbi:hypothetical protein HDU93_002218 [Gonapodya sp. JEL0774]|nr:hypothetical protein HDU93_002218 [Gonapodya sp. JEL0774]
MARRITKLELFLVVTVILLLLRDIPRTSPSDLKSKNIYGPENCFDLVGGGDGRGFPKHRSEDGVRKKRDIKDTKQPQEKTSSGYYSLSTMPPSPGLGTLSPDPGSPPQIFRHAYITLIFGTAQLWGSYTLFQSISETNPRADLVALVSEVDDLVRQNLHSIGIRTYSIKPLELTTKFDRFYLKRSAESKARMQHRDGILWAKLRAWQLDDYDKVVSLDSDMLVLKNIDELFNMPEISACPLSDWEFHHPSSKEFNKNDSELYPEDPDAEFDLEYAGTTGFSGTPIEKIQFWKTSDYGSIPNNHVSRKPNDPFAQGWMLPGWSGLNSGLVVLDPSNSTFTELLDELATVPSRPCCPSQELLYHFFEKRNRYFRLPTVYNARTLKGVSGSELEAKMRFMKVFHFVSEKPWGKGSKRSLHKRWAAVKSRVERRLLYERTQSPNNETLPAFHP